MWSMFQGSLGLFDRDLDLDVCTLMYVHHMTC